MVATSRASTAVTLPDGVTEQLAAAVLDQPFAAHRARPGQGNDAGARMQQVDNGA
jgi:hypothetical protein